MSKPTSTIEALPDMPPADKPPNRTSSKSPSSRRSSSRRQPLAPRIEQLHLTVGVALVTFAPSPAARVAGAKLAEEAKPISQAWSDYCAANPSVARIVERILTVSELGALIGAYLPVIMAVMEAQGRLPAAAASVAAEQPAQPTSKPTGKQPAAGAAGPVSDAA